MKKIVNLIVLVGLLLFGSCATQEPVSTINAPGQKPETYATTETVTVTHPDGTVVTTQKTTVLVPLEDGTYMEKVTEPEKIVEQTLASPVKANAPGLKTGYIEPVPDQIPYSEKGIEIVSKDFMTDRERDMLNEINLVRTNPAGYIAHIENYKADIQKSRADDIDFLETELIAADELIRLLKNMDPLPALKEHRGLYEVAKSHGNYIRKKGYPSHMGADGSYPWERITEAIPSLIDGNENLINGPSGVRESLILLLVDGAIQGRGHRRTLLQKDWQYGACYEVGEIEFIPNVWVQNFGKGGAAEPEVSIEKIKIDEKTDGMLAAVDNELMVSTKTNLETPDRNLNTEPESVGKVWGGVKPGDFDESVKVVSASKPDQTVAKTSIPQPKIAVEEKEPEIITKKTPAPEKAQILKSAEPTTMPVASEARSISTPSVVAEKQPTDIKSQPETNNKRPTTKDQLNLVKPKPEAASRPPEPIITNTSAKVAKPEVISKPADRIESPPVPVQEEVKSKGIVEAQNSLDDVPVAKPVPPKPLTEIAEVKPKPAVAEPKVSPPPPATDEKKKAESEIAKPPLPVVSTSTASEHVPLEERKLDTARPLTYMTDNEKDMILEINRVRANPKRYVRYVEEYKARLLRTSNRNSPVVKEELAAIDELISQLNSMEPVGILNPSEAVYRAAKGHGDELKTKGRSGHIGADGSYPWDRILREDSSLKDGNENLVGGPATVQEAVILLLIDSGIPNRGHRKTILNPQWKYVAVYEVGSLGSMKNNWIQNFAN